MFYWGVVWLWCWWYTSAGKQTKKWSKIPGMAGGVSGCAGCETRRWERPSGGATWPCIVMKIKLNFDCQLCLAGWLITDLWVQWFVGVRDVQLSPRQKQCSCFFFFVCFIHAVVFFFLVKVHLKCRFTFLKKCVQATFSVQAVDTSTFFLFMYFVRLTDGTFITMLA